MVDDERLIRAHRAGDPDAFPALVERYRDRVFRLCYRLSFDKDDALDLCQVTFWKAYRALAGYDRDGAFFTWLYRIATNAAIDLMRDRKRRRSIGFGPLGEDAEDLVSDRAILAGGRRPEPGRDDPARLVLQKELERQISRAVARLGPEHRATLLLRASEGLSYREIADVLDCPVGTVMSRLHVARERVREGLAEYLKGEYQ